MAVIGSLSPPFPGIGRGMASFFRFGYWACVAWPWFVGRVIRGEGRAARRAPLASLREGLSTYRWSRGDRAALDRPEVEGAFLESHLVCEGKENISSLLNACLVTGMYHRP